MTLREAVFDRCTGHAGTAALIGIRCYPDRLPENVTYPALTYVAPVSVSNLEYRTHDNANSPTTREVSRVQFNSYDTTGDGAAALADQIRAAWDGYQDGCDIGYAFQANRIMTREDALNAYRVILDIMVEHSTSI